MNTFFSRFLSLLERLDTDEASNFPRYHYAFLAGIRILIAIGRDIQKGTLALLATSMVYSTLLSIIPLFAVSFSIFKGFGVHNQLKPVLLAALEPLGDKASEITNSMLVFVDNMHTGVISSLGIVMLLYVVMSLMGKIEKALNMVFRVTENRSLITRIRNSLSILMIGPVFVLLAFGLMASLKKNESVQQLLSWDSSGILLSVSTLGLSFIMLSSVFSLLYNFVPNTRVSFASAFKGAMVAAFLWQVSSYAFASFVISGTQYTAIYSALATLIFFMIWLYLAWMILLLGASVAFYNEYPEYLKASQETLVMAPEQRERIAIFIMVTIAQRFYNGDKPLSDDELREMTRLPQLNLDRVIQPLVSSGYLQKIDDNGYYYLLLKAAENITVLDILYTIRGYYSANFQSESIQGVFQQINEQLQNQFDDVSLYSLLEHKQ